MSGALYLLGVVASKASSGLGLLHLLHVFLMWVISPGVGGFFAVSVTAHIFRSVPISTIYVSFVSVAAVLLVLLFLLGVLRVRVGGSTVGEMVIFVLQAAAIFLGARIGKTTSAINRDSDHLFCFAELQAVEGVTVKIKTLTSVTDRNGYFYFEKAPAGRKLILIDGSTSKEAQKEIGGCPFLSISLMPLRTASSITPIGIISTFIK